eukprot:PhM_4_TR14118/c0_g1_i1/m.43064
MVGRRRRHHQRLGQQRRRWLQAHPDADGPPGHGHQRHAQLLRHRRHEGVVARVERHQPSVVQLLEQGGGRHAGDDPRHAGHPQRGRCGARQVERVDPPHALRRRAPQAGAVRRDAALLRDVLLPHLLPQVGALDPRQARHLAPQDRVRAALVVDGDGAAPGVLLEALGLLQAPPPAVPAYEHDEEPARDDGEGPRQHLLEENEGVPRQDEGQGAAREAPRVTGAVHGPRPRARLLPPLVPPPRRDQEEEQALAGVRRAAPRYRRDAAPSILLQAPEEHARREGRASPSDVLRGPVVLHRARLHADRLPQMGTLCQDPQAPRQEEGHRRRARALA